MAVSPGGDTRRDGMRERRPAVWPWLVMPLIVLLLFYALFRVHQSAPTAPVAFPNAGATGAPGR